MLVFSITRRDAGNSARGGTRCPLGFADIGRLTLHERERV